jgi:hypothetical protein
MPGVEADARRELIPDRRRHRVLPVDDVGLLDLALNLPHRAVVMMIRRRVTPVIVIVHVPTSHRWIR